MKHLQTIDSKTLLSGQKISFLPIDQPKETKKTYVHGFVNVRFTRPSILIILISSPLVWEDA